MRPLTCPPAGICPRLSEKPGQRRALRAVRTTREAATLLEQTFRLMAEDDVLQPAIKYVYAALCEAETRALIIEDWYGRTYSESSPVK